MAISDLRKSLIQLLTLVAAERQSDCVDLYPSRAIGWHVPDDLLTRDTDVSNIYLQLTHKESTAYFECWRLLMREVEEGVLEHMDERELRALLQRTVSEVWLDRDVHNPTTIRSHAKQFLEEHSRTPATWSVLWEIRHLALEGKIQVGNVEFLVFNPSRDIPWLDLNDHPMADQVLFLRDAVFAQMQTTAGTYKKAIERAQPMIDDALAILRVAMSSLRFLQEMQRLQRRGIHCFAWTENGQFESHMGSYRAFEAVDLTLRDTTLSVVESQLKDLRFLFSNRMPAPLKDQLVRATIYIGSSMTRDNLDLRILDLTTSLESTLCARSDPLKAQTVSLRYLLLITSIGKASYVVHPFDLYYLYLMRNDLVHGSARRIGTEDAYRALRYVARDSVERTLALAQERPELKKLSHVFGYLQRPENIESAMDFISRHNAGDKAVADVRKLAESWLSKSN